MNSPTIRITHSQRGYFYNLISSNSQIVGTATRHFKTRKEVFEALNTLYLVRHLKTFVSLYKDKNKQWRFRHMGLLKSEGYKNYLDCENGARACINALIEGQVSLLYSEDTSVWPLAKLVQNPDKGYVAT